MVVNMKTSLCHKMYSPLIKLLSLMVRNHSATEKGILEISIVLIKAYILHSSENMTTCSYGTWE